MDPYAVVETGGRQYRVVQGNVLQVNRMAVEAGETIQLSPVCAYSDGEKLEIGTPEIGGAAVTCTVVEHTRGDKVVSFKKKRRKGYSRKVGHRQDLTVLKVESLTNS